MALIKCPECGKEISDKSDICIGCGFPIKEYLQKEQELEAERKREKELREKEEKELKERYLCRSCYKQNEIGEDYCVNCGNRLTPYTRESKELKDKRNVSIRHKEKIIEIQNGKMTLRFANNTTITDDVCNFTLEYFSVSLGASVGLLINNKARGYTSGIIDIVCSGKVKEDLKLFKEIMNNNGLYTERSRFDAIYNKTSEEKEFERSKKKEKEKLIKNTYKQDDFDEDFKGIYKYEIFGGKQRVYCPRCGSENCSHYQEQKIVPGKTKTKYTANLNPLKPLTLVNKKEKIIRKDQIVTESKFLCNSCGMIFK